MRKAPDEPADIQLNPRPPRPAGSESFYQPSTAAFGRSSVRESVLGRSGAGSTRLAPAPAASAALDDEVALVRSLRL